MTQSTNAPLTLYSRVEVDKPFSTLSEKYYVSQPYNPHIPILGNIHRGSFPSYGIDNYDYYNGENFHSKRIKVNQDPKPEVAKTEQVENNAEKLGTTNNMLSLFQVVMIIVLLMRLGRNVSTRLRRKHEERKKLLKFLDNENKKIRIDDKLMAEKLKKLEHKIQKEEEEMEVKWKEIRAKLKAKIKKNPSKNRLPGIGPYYDKDKMRLDRKMDAVNINYEKYKLKKEKRWHAMKAAYHKKLNKMHDKQSKRKRRKCKQMFLFERKWNFGPRTMKEYLKLKEEECNRANDPYTGLNLKEAATAAAETAETTDTTDATEKAEVEETAEEKETAETEKTVKGQESQEQAKQQKKGDKAEGREAVKTEEKAEEKEKKAEKEEENDEEYEYYVDEDYDDYADYEDDVNYYMNSDDE
ncbi:hypothetical protein AK88_04693 [Plasmodium fragile]|uniref:Uncharacterized protein n=1 Tax=Plasmodium fragile TaxID=5857 RepID=A0A0D9QFT4_PLAFR|nr:uncharacterized protein AK88_04693 [Plasmodium fragile]KJP85662.1 hypothetical protein AK88_04693 [Plasmodium fragile]